ncbi:MAG: sulfatase, partial [Acidobacteria bacterium]|nr:sulfatase [Acidobacteriota bacterium]
MRTRLRFTALACVLAGLFACDREPPRPSVILISVDTLRSDYLALYNREGVPTPALEALRADGVLYRLAYAPIPLTLPAHLTALTGLLPSQHGVRDNGGFRFEASGRSYLPQRLHGLGYATGAFVSSFVLRGNSGMATGFDVYDDDLSTAGSPPFGTLQRPGAQTIQRALDWVEGVKQGPFFLFLHLYEPHLPYAAPAEFTARFPDPYAAEVAYADSLLAGFFARLRQLGLYEPALILFMSDHGEGLGDHQYQEHGLLLYREALQVPLILKAPSAKGAGETVDTPVQLADIAPTIERWVGLETDPSVEGRPLQEAGPDAVRTIVAETFLPRLHYGWSELSSVIEFPYHLIWGPQPELYDLANDPAELNDIFEAM